MDSGKLLDIAADQYFRRRVIAIISFLSILLVSVAVVLVTDKSLCHFSETSGNILYMVGSIFDTVIPQTCLGRGFKILAIPVFNPLIYIPALATGFMMYKKFDN